MQGEQIPNPITMAFSLIEGYQELLRSTLRESVLTEEDLAHVLANLEDVGVDNQIFFSLNRQYELAAETFETFCREHLSEVLLKAVYRSASEKNRFEDLYRHQAEGIRHITAGRDTIIATGTGSGKTETFLFPILDHCLKHPGEGVKALIIYPMNALANDQLRRLASYVQTAREDGHDLSYGSFTGQTPKNEQDAREKEIEVELLSDGHVVYRDDMRRRPPDILITNYVMLEWMLTRQTDRPIFEAASESLQYVVLDELHTYRGNKATHLRGLLRRLVHAVTRRPVYVGTSATLTGGGEDEVRADDVYLTRTQQSDIDAFVKPLLDTEHYELVLPRYARMPTPPDVRPIPELDEEAELGWDMRFDTAAGLEQLARLTGEELIEWDLESEDGEPSHARTVLGENAFVVAVTEALQEGPLAFTDVVDVIRPLLSEGTADPVELAKAYLSAVAFVNHFAEGEALLDFRIHLFLKDLGGHLQSCLRCRRYHSGKQDVCSECGWPLFMVHRDDIHEVIGKVSGRELRRQLWKESDDPDMTYLTRIRLSSEPSSLNGEGVADDRALHFDETAPATAESIQLLYNESGALALQLVPRDAYSQPMDLTIPLVTARKDHQYLLNLVTSILQSQEGDDQKLLGFIDNREHASRYVAILGDEFAGQYFEALLSLYRSDLGMRTLTDALPFLIERLEEAALTEAERELLTELPAWLSRELSRSPRSGRVSAARSLFQVEAPPKAGPELLESFTPLQREILDLFFDERAVDKRFLIPWLPELQPGKHQQPAETHTIKFQRYLVWQHHGVAFEGQAASSKQFTSVALGKRSQVYADLIERHGVDEIREAVQSLVDDGNSPRLPLVARVVEEGENPKTHFYLKADWVRVAASSTPCRNHTDVRRRHFLTAALHTSDVQGEDRASAEERFQDGDISFMLATRTLEMGVDIGQLKTVLMVGTPPLPSNYAQRAGRAGRSGKDRYALITSFCSDDNNHDRYYFDRPKEMVAGYISPPAFDPANVSVLSKHVHALVLREVVDKPETFAAFVHRVDEHLPAMIEEAQEVFGDDFDVEAYLCGDFLPLLDMLKRQVSDADLRPLHLFYKNGVFPDYGFRRDEVAVLDYESARQQNIDLRKAEQRHDYETFNKLRVTGRDPEQAYYKLHPGETVFMAGDAFSIGDDSPFYDVIEVDDEREVRSYRYLYGYRSDDPSRDDEVKRYERQRWLSPEEKAQEKEVAGLLKVEYHPEAMLCFRNLGVLLVDSVEERKTVMGYDLPREALAFSLPDKLTGHPHLFVSLLSALDRAIKDHYGLDENDLRLMLEVPVRTAARVQSKEASEAAPRLCAVLYDADGNGNAPLERIFAELETPRGALQHAYDVLTNCPNDDCERGCYLCLRSYSTHYYAAEVDKAAATMVVGYLLGKNPFVPDLRPPVTTGDGHIDLALEVDISGDRVTVQALDERYVEEVNGSQNAAIFAALSRGAQAEYREGRHVLRVVVRPSVGYLTDFVNETRVGNKARSEDKQAFEKLLFELLRYPSVHAVPYEQL